MGASPVALAWVEYFTSKLGLDGWVVWSFWYESLARLLI